MPKKVTTDGFIVKSIEIHKNKFNYSKTIYTNNKTKVCIICPVHGEFYQLPSNHLYGYGCIECGIENNKLHQSSNIDEFIKKANKIHNHFYDYSKVNYKTAHKKIEIICPRHGSFFQKPNNHLNKRGCKLCGMCERGVKRRNNTDYFINKAKQIHGDYYDYSKSHYVNLKTKIEIVCKIHGSFFVRPNNHTSQLLKRGCPKCHKRVSKKEMEFLNYLKIPNTVTNRQKFVNIFQVDGIRNKKIYEFLGDFWHGNPKKYNFNKINEITNKTFGELYKKTFEKFNKLNDLGYSIYYMWENDWNLWIKNKINTFPIKKYNGNKI